MRTECLADALDNRVEFGVWGGMTERELLALGIVKQAELEKLDAEDKTVVRMARQVSSIKVEALAFSLADARSESAAGGLLAAVSVNSSVAEASAS